MGTRNSTPPRRLSVTLALATPVAAQKHQPPRAQQRAERREERQAARPPQPLAHHAGEWLRQHKGVPPDQQQKALESDPQFRNLPPERQQLLRDRLQRFNSLPPQRQDRILNGLELWGNLLPGQNRKARKAFAHYSNLPLTRAPR